MVYDLILNSDLAHKVTELELRIKVLEGGQSEDRKNQSEN
jgi:hypothetical protein